MPRVEDNILAVTNAMLKDRRMWQHVTRRQKEEFFFIVNRLLSRRLPDVAAALNDRHGDKAAAMDAWFALFEGRPYPSWMWAKRQSAPGGLEEVAAEHGLCGADMELLARLHPNEISEEIKLITKTKNKKE